MNGKDDEYSHGEFSHLEEPWPDFERARREIEERRRADPKFDALMRRLRSQKPVSKANPYHDEEGKFTSEGEAVEPQGEGKRAGPRGMVPAPADRKQWPEHLAGLRLPPAWKNVRISTDPRAALLVTGTDAKGRTQYLYSRAYGQSQSAAKFARIQELDRKFAGIQKENDALRQSDDERVRQLADCTALIMLTGTRPGSDADTRAKVKAYGATTLEGRHVVAMYAPAPEDVVDLQDLGQLRPGDPVGLQFVGKKGVDISLPIRDPSLARMLVTRARTAGPNGRLFPRISDSQLLDHVHCLNGGQFKTKDFRTLLGTRIALEEMKKQKVPTTEKEYKKAVKAVATVVSRRLSNTPAVALQSYISPVVFSKWRAKLSRSPRPNPSRCPKFISATPRLRCPTGVKVRTLALTTSCCPRHLPTSWPCSASTRRKVTENDDPRRDPEVARQPGGGGPAGDRAHAALGARRIPPGARRSGPADHEVRADAARGAAGFVHPPSERFPAERRNRRHARTVSGSRRNAREAEAETTPPLSCVSFPCFNSLNSATPSPTLPASMALVLKASNCISQRSRPFASLTMTGWWCVTVFVYATLVRPPPGYDFRHVGAVLISVVTALGLLIAELFQRVSSDSLKLRRAINYIDR